MKTSPLYYSLLLAIMLFVWSCVTTGSQSTGQNPSVSNPQPTVASPQTTTASQPEKRAKKPAMVFDHKSERDTVHWASTNTGRLGPIAGETDRERLGERLGLIGPIVSTHGVGHKRFILVYDAAGVLVGGLTYKAHKKDPKKFEALIRKAHKRSEHQNYMALRHLMYKRLATQLVAQQAKEGGRHDK